ncbi:hypothetical protein AH81_17985, partial [Salmonella enterica subsp. enterica serovar Tennessee]
PDGSWAYTFTSDLTEGLHQVYVKVEDIAGNKANSAVFDFTIDTTVSTPVISLLSKDDTGVPRDTRAIAGFQRGDTRTDFRHDANAFVSQNDAGFVTEISVFHV